MTTKEAREHLDRLAASAEAEGRHGARRGPEGSMKLARILERERDLVATLEGLGFSQVDVREELTRYRNARWTI